MAYVYMLSNYSIKIFFSLKEMNAAIKVAEQVVQYLPPNSKAPKADTILFDYNVGRIYLHFHRFVEADDSLTKAFKECHSGHPQNARRILTYLVVARFVRGKLPSEQLLAKYQLSNFFSRLVHFFRVGNFAGYLTELETQKSWLISHGFYLIMLHRTQLLLYRNLFSKM